VLDPAQWKNGAAVVSAVTARIPAGLVLPLDRPGPATPAPQPAAGQPAKSGSADQQPAATRKDRLLRIVTGQTFLVVCLGVLLIGGVVWANSSGSQGSVPLGLVAAVLVGRLIARNLRRRRRR
jgi:hypothetical protein